MSAVGDFLRKFDYILTGKDKKTIALLIAFSIIVSVFEILSITTIMPYVSIVSDPTIVKSNEYISVIYDFFELESVNSLLLYFSIVLIFLFSIKVLLVTFFNYKIYSFAAQKYSDVGLALYKVYLRKKYSEFLTYNSALLTKSIVLEARYISHIVSSLLTVLSELLIAILIISVLLFVNFKLTAFLIVFLAVKVLFLIRPITKRLKIIGGIRDEVEVGYYKISNETFGNFKAIKLLQNYEEMEGRILNTSLNYKNIITKYMTLMQLPRLLLEAAALITVVLIVLYSIFVVNTADIVPLITMYVVAFYRLLPSVNKVVSGVNQIVFYTKSLNLVYEDLNTDFEKVGDEKLVFSENININDVSFKYGVEAEVFSNVNVEIEKNSKIAFIGESGSGKSTLVDILMGFHFPTSGKMYVDGKLLTRSNLKSWREKIGYIPQSIYLFDGTIAENVVFGRTYNEDHLVDILKKVNLWSYLQGKEGLATQVGEAGLALSGGQKQRIAIARALYDNPEILVLDEATSALDDATEQKIMNEIYNLSEKITLIIIAHRLSTIQQCDVIYEFENGKLLKSNFEKIMQNQQATK